MYIDFHSDTPVMPAELQFLLTETPAERTTTTYLETVMLLEAAEDMISSVFSPVPTCA